MNFGPSKMDFVEPHCKKILESHIHKYPGNVQNQGKLFKNCQMSRKSDKKKKK